MNGDGPVVYLVDDDPSILKGITRLLGAAGLRTKPFRSPRAFLDEHDASQPGCIVLDLSMPELSGLDLQQMLASTNKTRPIVFISGRDDVPASVSAMKAGASDFLTKPIDGEVLLGAVRKAIEKDRSNREDGARLQDLEKRLYRLTLRERQVLEGVVCGQLNKQIGIELGIVEKTVKVHRSRVMSKLGVRSVVELMQLAGELGLAPLFNYRGQKRVL
jgi:FixJ family two-component response regulator